jgi:hypothetical protein
MPRNHTSFNPKTYEHIPATNIIGNDSDSTNIYYNVMIYNNSTNYDPSGNPIDTVLSVAADFSQQRAKPYIGKPSDYFATITYFHLDSNSFPSQIVQPIVGKSYLPATTFNGTTIEGFPLVYAFNLSMTYSGGTVDDPISYVYWKPLDSTLTAPPSPITKKDLQNEYFWNYSFDYFLDLLNNSIAYRMDTMVNAVSPGNYAGDKPYFKHDGETDLMSFNAPLTFRTKLDGTLYSAPGVGEYFWKIYLNEPLYQLVQSLSSLYGPGPDFYGYQILCMPNPGNTNIIQQSTSFATVPPTVTSNYMVMLQQYPSSPLWNPVVSIVFTTPVLCVVNQMKALPYIDGINPNPPSNNADSLNILFEYFIGRRADPTINNFVRAEYRLTDLLSIQPESQLIVQTFWKDEFGQLHPFFIEQGCGMNMKILFRKKIFYK